jgi:hypothetical protein
VFSLEPELQSLRPRLGDAVADALIARERREVFSVYPELRIAGWLGATLLAAAAGVLLKNNLDRIGPLALAIGIGVAALACYAWTWWRRRQASVVDDYVLLLGALLVSADVAFIESQFHVFGDAWKRHLLLLAVLHGIGAYLYGSRILLSLAITSLGGYLGFDKKNGFDDAAIPAFELAALLLTWREVHRRFDDPRIRDFAPSFEHFAANIAFAGSIALMFEDRTRIIGCLLALVIAAAVIFWGVRTKGEMFVLYAVLYAVLAVDVLFAEVVGEDALIFFFIVLSIIGAIVALFAIHARVREWRT